MSRFAIFVVAGVLAATTFGVGSAEAATMMAAKPKACPAHQHYVKGVCTPYLEGLWFSKDPNATATPAKS
jgi:hypothetical protein